MFQSHDHLMLFTIRKEDQLCHQRKYTFKERTLTYVCIEIPVLVELCAYFLMVDSVAIIEVVRNVAMRRQSVVDNFY